MRNPPRSATQEAVSGEGSVTARFEMSFQEARLVFHAVFNPETEEYRLWSRRANSAFAGRVLVDASTPLGRAYCSVRPLPQPAQGSSFSTKISQAPRVVLPGGNGVGDARRHPSGERRIKHVHHLLTGGKELRQA